MTSLTRCVCMLLTRDILVAQVDARSLELLCEDMGSAADNAEFNKIMHRVLGIAEQAALALNE